MPIQTTYTQAREHLASLLDEVTDNVSVQRYLLAGAFDDGVTYWIQAALPGAPPASLRHDCTTVRRSRSSHGHSLGWMT